MFDQDEQEEWMTVDRSLEQKATKFSFLMYRFQILLALTSFSPQVPLSSSSSLIPFSV